MTRRERLVERWRRYAGPPGSSPQPGKLHGVVTNDVDLAILHTATSAFSDAVAGIGEDQWELPTPCAEWNLRNLVDHVVGGNWYTVQVFAGDTSEQALNTTMSRFGGGSASTTAAIKSAHDQRAAFGTAHVLDQSWNHVAGELLGRQILRLRLHDLIVHTWDINQTYRPPVSVPKALAEWGLSELESPHSLMAQHFKIPRSNNERPHQFDTSTAYLGAFGR